MDGTRLRSTGGVILIAIGIFFLAVNLAGGRPWSMPLGLGVALLFAFLVSDWYGLSVAGCLLAAVGVFGLLQNNGWLIWDRSLTFFLVLGLGFLAIYPVSRRWHLWWPVMPGVVLIWVGAVPLVIAETGWMTLEQWAGLVRWWPLLVVLAGLWLAGRHLLPDGWERPARLAILIVVVAICLFLLTALSASLALEPAQAAPLFSRPPRWR